LTFSDVTQGNVRTHAQSGTGVQRKRVKAFIFGKKWNQFLRGRMDRIFELYAARYGERWLSPRVRKNIEFLHAQKLTYADIRALNGRWHIFPFDGSILSEFAIRGPAKSPEEIDTIVGALQRPTIHEAIQEYIARYSREYVNDAVIANVLMLDFHQLGPQDLWELWRNHGIHNVERDMLVESTRNLTDRREKSGEELAKIARELVPNPPFTGLVQFSPDFS